MTMTYYFTSLVTHNHVEKTTNPTGLVPVPVSSLFALTWIILAVLHPTNRSIRFITQNRLERIACRASG